MDNKDESEKGSVMALGDMEGTTVGPVGRQEVTSVVIRVGGKVGVGKTYFIDLITAAVKEALGEEVEVDTTLTDLKHDKAVGGPYKPPGFVYVKIIEDVNKR